MAAHSVSTGAQLIDTLYMGDTSQRETIPLFAKSVHPASDTPLIQSYALTKPSWR